MLIMMALSMTATKSTGMEAERKTTAMMAKTAAMEAILTLRKSVSATSIRSLVIAPSPLMTPAGSYRLTMAFSSVSWLFCRSEPLS